MLTPDINQAWTWVATLAGDPNITPIDWRAIHDTNKEIPAIPFRGTISECWQSINHYNQQGYGIFANVNQLDGRGRELVNVTAIRAHYIDLDNSSALQNFERASNAQPLPSLGVQSSPGKFHLYWPVYPYTGNDYFQIQQRKLRQLYDGDKAVVDATRVMRVPGTYHLKEPSTPHMVMTWPLGGYGSRIAVETLAASMAGVNVIDGGLGVRHELGDPSLAAPSLAWLQRALELLDPNSLDRGEWIALTSAIKQAGWTLADPDTLFKLWLDWCARYHANDLGENIKQWNSIRNTELGWSSLVRRVPTLQAVVSFGPSGTAMPHAPGVNGSAVLPPATGDDIPPMPEPPALDCSGEYLTHLEQQQWFKDCIFIIADGAMFVPDGRLLNTNSFNVAYGGKKFLIDTQGKTTNEPWQAATRSTLWTVPKVDHRRFVPSEPYRAILTDALGRKGINVYNAIKPERIADGDVHPFIDHMKRLLPDANDQRILFDYLAHNARYPGFKIPWAPVIQSAEGAGKGVLKSVMLHVLGRPYVYFPNAKELTNSGSQFNAWMRNKLFILADEIKVDDRRDLIEVLKPMISEEIIEIQGKGIDQELEDNFSNWLFFTNWKDAVPINRNARRFALMYSPLQTAQDLLAQGMDDRYFKWLYDWIRGDNGQPFGAAIVANWLLDYPIERGAVPMRAPDTSSAAEAVQISRSPLERIIWEAIEDGLPGFRGGWISSVAVAKRARDTGAVRGGVAPQTVGTVVEGMGYVANGRSPRSYFSEDKDTRPYLWHFGQRADPEEYGPMQGFVH